MNVSVKKDITTFSKIALNVIKIANHVCNNQIFAFPVIKVKI
jgi:hypothetical protein